MHLLPVFVKNSVSQDYFRNEPGNGGKAGLERENRLEKKGDCPGRT